MFFMKYPIDVFFMSRSGYVEKVIRNVKPWGMAHSRGSYYAMEVNAGAKWTSDIQVGSHLTWVK